MKAASSADLVREYSARHYVNPARVRGDAVVRIVAGDVHKAIHLSNRVPLVCQALSSRKFMEENDLVLEKLEGPPSGLGTKATFIYRFTKGGSAGAAHREWPFLALRGIAKNLYGAEGGETFLRREREQFYGPSGVTGMKS
jgi:hypothetical protein